MGFIEITLVTVFFIGLIALAKVLIKKWWK